MFSHVRATISVGALLESAHKAAFNCASLRSQPYCCWFCRHVPVPSLEGAKTLAVITGCEPDVSMKDLAKCVTVFVAALPGDFVHTLVTEL